MKRQTHFPAPTGVCPALLTIPQAAEYINATTHWTVRQLIYKGELSFVKVGKRFNIRREDLDSWIARHVQKAVSYTHLTLPTICSV